ncbi:MAG: site-specific integrase [Gammaproteobacteria bacterium]|nr:site-specific integrase [Gammaproteobacteria bacterium]
MATITKTPSNTWKALIRKRGWPTAIKTFRTKRDALDWARRTEDEMVRGVYIDRADASQLLLKTAMDRYLREVSSTKKPSTHTAEQHKAKALKAELGGYSLAALNPNLIAGYRDQRLAAGKSANTVRLELSLLSHLFTIAIKEWRLGLVYNPVANIRKPPPGQGRNRRLKDNEESVLLKACDEYSNPMLSWIVRTALFTSMRASEITSLRRNQVDLAHRVVRLTDTKNGSARTVTLSRKALPVLASALNYPVRPLDTDLIFWGEPGRDGNRRAYEFRMAWKKIIRDTEIKNLRFHDLRHEAVSRLVEAGLGDQEVAAISGHKSMQMLKRYTHLRAEDLVERLDQLMV